VLQPASSIFLKDNSVMPSEYQMTSEDTLFGRIPAEAKIRPIKGPSLVVIGWIPFFYPWGYFLSASTSAYRNHSRRQLGWIAFMLLFLTGNRPAPPATFDHADALPSFLSFPLRKQFRAAIAISDLTLYCDDDGRPFRFTCRWLTESGFTPIPLWPGKPWLGGEAESADPEFSPLPAGDGVACTLKLKFRIGGLGRQIAEWFVGVVPWAQFTVSYRLRSDGTCDIFCEGTQIPSQSFYKEWVSMSKETHDMLGNSEADINAFHFSGLEPPISKKWTARS